MMENKWNLNITQRTTVYTTNHASRIERSLKFKWRRKFCVLKRIRLHARVVAMMGVCVAGKRSPRLSPPLVAICLTLTIVFPGFGEYLSPCPFSPLRQSYPSTRGHASITTLSLTKVITRSLIYVSLSWQTYISTNPNTPDCSNT